MLCNRASSCSRTGVLNHPQLMGQMQAVEPWHQTCRSLHMSKYLASGEQWQQLPPPYCPISGPLGSLRGTVIMPDLGTWELAGGSVGPSPATQGPRRQHRAWGGSMEPDPSSWHPLQPVDQHQGTHLACASKRLSATIL